MNKCIKKNILYKYIRYYKIAFLEILMQYLFNFFMSATTKTLAVARETRGKTHSIAENEHLNLSEEKLPQSLEGTEQRTAVTKRTS